MNPQVWWYLSRATGVVGWGLASLSVLWGLALSGRPFGRNPTGPWLLDLHRYLGGLSVLFVGAHVGSIVADSYVHFGWADVFVPMATGYKSLAVAWGIVSMYFLVRARGDLAGHEKVAATIVAGSALHERRRVRRLDAAPSHRRHRPPQHAPAVGGGGEHCGRHVPARLSCRRPQTG